MSAESIIKRILALRPKLTRETVKRLIKEERARAAGLLTEEAAAHLVSSNFGVDKPVEDGGMCHIPADDILALVDEIEALAQKLRDLGLQGFSTKGEKQTKAKGIPIELNLDISGIQFFQKNRNPAGPDASWGWCFGYTKNGDYHNQSKNLVQAIEQYGKIRVGDLEYTLGGQDGKLLNFRRVKNG